MFNIDKIIPIDPSYNFLILRKIMIIFSLIFICISISLLHDDLSVIKKHIKDK